MMMSADDQVEAVLARVLGQRSGWRARLDRPVLDAHAGALGAVPDLSKSRFEIKACRARRVVAVGGGLGVRRRVCDRDREQLGVVAARQIDGRIKSAAAQSASRPRRSGSAGSSAQDWNQRHSDDQGDEHVEQIGREAPGLQPARAHRDGERERRRWRVEAALDRIADGRFEPQRAATAGDQARAETQRRMTRIGLE
jgi:hypothetical protein